MSTLYDKFKKASLRMMAPAMLLGATSVSAGTTEPEVSFREQHKSVSVIEDTAKGSIVYQDGTQLYVSETATDRVIDSFTPERRVMKSYSFFSERVGTGNGYFVEQTSVVAINYDTASGQRFKQASIAGVSKLPGSKSMTQSLSLVGPNGERVDLDFLSKELEKMTPILYNGTADRYKVSRRGHITKLDTPSPEQAAADNNRARIKIMRKCQQQGLTTEQTSAVMGYVKRCSDLRYVQTMSVKSLTIDSHMGKQYAGRR